MDPAERLIAKHAGKRAGALGDEQISLRVDEVVQEIELGQPESMEVIGEAEQLVIRAWHCIEILDRLPNRQLKKVITLQEGHTDDAMESLSSAITQIVSLPSPITI